MTSIGQGVGPRSGETVAASRGLYVQVSSLSSQKLSAQGKTDSLVRQAVSAGVSSSAEL